MYKKDNKKTTFKKYTLVCAINSNGIIGYELYEKGGMTVDRMIDFINKFINGKYTNDQKIPLNTIIKNQSNRKRKPKIYKNNDL